MEARILKVALDFDALESAGKTKMDAFDELKRREGWYDSTVVHALKAAFADEIKYDVKTTVVAELQHGMILGEDIRTASDVLLASKGQEVNESIILRMQNFSKAVGVKEPFTVLVPMGGQHPTETVSELHRAA